MNWLDFLLAGILLIGLVRGFMNGFVYEIAHLGAYFLGLYAGFALANTVAEQLTRITGAAPALVHGISFTVVFILVWIGVLLLGKLFTGLVEVAFLGVFNRWAGAIFGSLKFAVLLSIFIVMFHKADIRMKLLSPDTKAGSFLYYRISRIAPAVLPVLEDLGQ